MATSSQQIKTSAVPDLPSPGRVYDPLYFNQLNGMLRLYFTKITDTLRAVLGIRGGQYLNMPYGAFQSTQTQSVASSATPTKVTFNVTDYSNGVTHVSGDGFHVSQAGIYNIQFSCQLTNSLSQVHDADIWIRKGVGESAATDLANTASVTSVQGTHGGHPGYMVLAANFYVDLDVDEYIEFWWAASDTNVQLNYLPAITTPFASPGAPSFVATVSFVSNKTA